MLIPSIIEIELALRFRTLKYLFFERLFIFVILLLLTSNQSKCKGVYFRSSTDTSSLLLAFILTKYLSPDKYFKDLSLLYDISIYSKNS